MLFWIILSVAVLATILWFTVEHGIVVAAVCWVIVGFMLFVIVSSNVSSNAYVARNLRRYDMICYQLENNLYDNDNDLGKKELYNQVQSWNEDLAYYQAVQYDFWIGIFTPDVFEQFSFIELERQ